MVTAAWNFPSKETRTRLGGLDAFWIERDPEDTPEKTSDFTRPKEVNGAFAVLSGLYSIPHTSPVQNFLVHRRAVRELLFSAFPHIKKIFGEATKAELRLIQGMDNNDSERLRVTIISDRENARQGLEQFDEEWWLDHVQNSDGLLNFVLRRE